METSGSEAVIEPIRVLFFETSETRTIMPAEIISLTKYCKAATLGICLFYYRLFD